VDWYPDELRLAGPENLDADHVRRYDAKMDAGAVAEVELLRREGVLRPGCTVVDLGAGSGQFALAAAAVAGRVVAVDVSSVMLARLEEKPGAAALEVVRGGFLTYEHAGDPADLLYSRFALHHLPDFWKAIALQRMAGMLRPGGHLRLSDVVYGFDASEAHGRIEAWIETNVSTDVESGWTRAELAEHVRDEHSTFTWLLEPMIERAGFEILDAEHDDDGMLARYLCRLPEPR
jgi:SAM-dependent methyltransferase